MLINEVVSKVGLTRKTIRYYEMEGLLKPNRNKDNDYREYDEEDILFLKKIKFLRELNVPIRDIKSLLEKRITLVELMNERMKKITEEMEDYEKIKSLCGNIIEENSSWENFDIELMSQEMNILNKKGVTMRDIKENHKSKIIGACLSSLLFSSFFAIILGIMVYFQITETEKCPWVIFVFLMGILIFPVIGALYNLVVRIHEIKGGEEDEASKY